MGVVLHNSLRSCVIPLKNNCYEAVWISYSENLAIKSQKLAILGARTFLVWLNRTKFWKQRQFLFSSIRIICAKCKAKQYTFAFRVVWSRGINHSRVAERMPCDKEGASYAGITRTSVAVLQVVQRAMRCVCRSWFAGGRVPGWSRRRTGGVRCR